MKTIAAIVAAVAVTLCVLPGAQAETKKKDPPGPPAPFLISSVDVAGKKIVISHGTADPQEYTFNDFTRVIVDGQQATADKIQVGMRAVPTVGSDGKQLSRIDVMTYTPPKSPATQKKK